jgi:HEPN domain-containing protein
VVSGQGARVARSFEFVALRRDIEANRTHRPALVLSRDETALAGALPVSAAEAAHRAVAADALRELIRDTEQMLRDRGWESALAELSRGDRQLEKGDWVDAVREYYAALESGLKHRLDEFGAKYNERDALRDLAKHAARTGAIPRNYQDLFSFADSIRSPRSHGAGVKTVEVEVGPAEALLMGNHVRALLLYLGQRPR